jgi:hypothetical protein
VSMALVRPWRSVAMYALGSEIPTMLEPVVVAGRMELHLPPFSYYAALEFRS